MDLTTDAERELWTDTETEMGREDSGAAAADDDDGDRDDPLCCFLFLLVMLVLGVWLLSSISTKVAK